MRLPEQIRATLDEHEIDFAYDRKMVGCSCGSWRVPGPVSIDADHADHQAAMLAPLIVASNQEAYDAGYHQAKEDGDLYDTQATYTPPTLNNGDTK